MTRPSRDRAPGQGDAALPGDVRGELHALRGEVARLNSHRFIRMHNSLPRLLLFNLMRGLAFGLGTVLGATVLISAVAWSFSQFEFLPLIGEWAAEVARIMNDIAADADGSQ